jgi:hypothetical protein
MWMEITKKYSSDSIKNSDKDDLKKRRPKPFRYVTNLSEVYDGDELLSETVMTTKADATVKKLMEQFDSVVGIGDVSTIERVLQKHEKRNKKHDPSIG